MFSRKFKRKIKNFFKIFKLKYLRNFFLCLKYPFLKIQTDTYPWVSGYDFTWLDEIPIGWRNGFGIQMCKDIKQYLKDNHIKNYHIRQMKEKWNVLHIYDNANDDFYEKIHKKYEKISEETCVFCGKPSKWVSCNGWIESVCDDCKNKLINERGFRKFDKLKNEK